MYLLFPATAFVGSILNALGAQNSRGPTVGGSSAGLKASIRKGEPGGTDSPKKPHFSFAQELVVNSEER